MPSKLVITLKDGQKIESETLEHHVNIAGDLVIAGYPKPIDATKWKSAHIEETIEPKPKAKKKPATPKKEKNIES